jgi:exosome complex component RRP42
LIDASALAAVAALTNTKMPNYEVEDGEVKIKTGYSPLPLNSHPITVTIAKINDKLVVDPWIEEEQVMDARISMAVNDEGNICAIQKGCAGFFTPQQVVEASKIAQEKAAELRKKLGW